MEILKGFFSLIFDFSWYTDLVIIKRVVLLGIFTNKKINKTRLKINTVAATDKENTIILFKWYTM